MYFQDRHEAGMLLAKKLEAYRHEKVVVFGLPRGGVVTASVIAKALHAPLDLVIAHKIGHPYQPEYAIAAIAEGKHLIENPSEIQRVDPLWYKAAQQHELQEIERRRKKYLPDPEERSLTDTVAIVVDDGVATGLTMKAAIQSVRARNPKKIIIAVPVAPKSTFTELRSLADACIGLEVPDDWSFLGAIGAYYEIFDQTSDQEVITLVQKNRQELPQWNK